MSIKKMFLLGTALAFTICLSVGYYEYNKPVQDVADLDAKSVGAMTLLKDYASNEKMANNSYLNKALQVTGKVMEIKHGQDNQIQVLLDTGDPMSVIACTMKKMDKEVKPGEQVTIKGICTGYLNDVVLINSMLL